MNMVFWSWLNLYGYIERIRWKPPHRWKLWKLGSGAPDLHPKATDWAPAILHSTARHPLSLGCFFAKNPLAPPSLPPLPRSPAGPRRFVSPRGQPRCIDSCGRRPSLWPRGAIVVWTYLGPLPRWVPGPTTRWAPGTTRLALHGTW
jgi:hypothetical protein